MMDFTKLIEYDTYNVCKSDHYIFNLVLYVNYISITLEEKIEKGIPSCF